MALRVSVANAGEGVSAPRRLASADPIRGEERRLRARAVGLALPALANGLIARRGDRDGPIVGVELDDVFRETQALLYRLLARLFLEARDPSGFSSGWRDRLRSADCSADPRATGLCDWLAGDACFTAADAPREVRFEASGLVSVAPRVSEWARVADRFLARALEGLTTDSSGQPVDCAAIGVRLFGSLYEGLLETRLRLEPDGSALLIRVRGARAAHGCFYTPRHVVRAIVARSVAPLFREHLARVRTAMGTPPAASATLGDSATADERERDLLEGALAFRVLDPAMGSGHFLVEAIDIIAATLLEDFQRDSPAGRAGWSLMSLRRLVLEHCIYGVDLDPSAVELARLSLALHGHVPGGEGGRGMPRPYNVGGAARSESGRALESEDGRVASRRGDWAAHLEVGNALLGMPDGWREHGGGADARFEVVVGNPPYLNVKRGIDPEIRAALRARYTLARGQWDVGALFFEAALGAWLRLGGAVGLVAPKPFFLSESYEPLRRLLLESADRTDFAPCGPCFDEPGVEAAIVVARRRPPSNAPIAVADGRDGQAVRPWKSMPKALFAALPFRAFSCLVDPALLAVIQRGLDDGSLVELGTLVHWTRGVEAGKRDPAIRSRADETTRPLILGESLRPFHAQPTAYLAPHGCAGRTKSAALYLASPKTLLRRVALAPIAAVDDLGAHVLNTIYVAHSSPVFDPHALAALLNSAVIRALYVQLFNADDRLFPYLRLSQVARLPIPRRALCDPLLAQWAIQIAQQRAPLGEARLALESRVAEHYGVARDDAAALFQRYVLEFERPVAPLAEGAERDSTSRSIISRAVPTPSSERIAAPSAAAARA